MGMPETVHDLQKIPLGNRAGKMKGRKNGGKSRGKCLKKEVKEEEVKEVKEESVGPGGPGGPGGPDPAPDYERLAREWRFWACIQRKYLDALCDENPARKRLALGGITALAQYTPEVAVVVWKDIQPAVVEAARHPDTSIRLAGLEAIGAFSTVPEVATLIAHSPEAMQALVGAVIGPGGSAAEPAEK